MDIPVRDWVIHNKGPDMNLLVIDWDFFFPHPDPGDEDWQMYDWGHSEQRAPAFQDFLWRHRAATFWARNKTLPGLSGLETTFWDRFQIAKNARLYVSDSNLWSMHWRVRRGVTNVLLFDAHHDAGYNDKLGEYWSCENWAIWYVSSDIPVRVHYPRWRKRAFEWEPTAMAETMSYWSRKHFGRGFDLEQPIDMPIHRIHVCRSGAWVPPWLDEAFRAFILACPVSPKRFATLEDVSPRAMDMPTIEDDARQMREAWERFAAEHHIDPDTQQPIA